MESTRKKTKEEEEEGILSGRIQQALIPHVVLYVQVNLQVNWSAAIKLLILVELFEISDLHETLLVLVGPNAILTHVVDFASWKNYTQGEEDSWNEKEWLSSSWFCYVYSKTSTIIIVWKHKGHKEMYKGHSAFLAQHPDIHTAMIYITGWRKNESIPQHCMSYRNHSRGTERTITKGAKQPSE